jgi:hypothetical protein
MPLAENSAKKSKKIKNEILLPLHPFPLSPKEITKENAFSTNVEYYSL